jgi:uncharacterized protein
MLYLILPLIALVIAQVSKIFVKSNREKASFKVINSYAGMPSGHAAFVTSLVTIIGIRDGIFSPLFAISLVFAVIIIRDAVGLRRYLGEHGRILNELVKDLKEEPDKPLDQIYPHLLEKIGHTPAQVLVGALIGFLTSLIGFFIGA